MTRDSRLLWPDRPIPAIGQSLNYWRYPTDVIEWGASLQFSRRSTLSSADIEAWRPSAVARLFEDAREHLPAGTRYEIRQMFGDFSTSTSVAWYRLQGGPGCFDAIPNSEWDTEIPMGGLWDEHGCVLLLGRCVTGQIERVVSGDMPPRPLKDPVIRDDKNTHEVIRSMRFARGFSPERANAEIGEHNT